MIRPAIRILLLLVTCCLVGAPLIAQGEAPSNFPIETEKPSKPYRVLTAGKLVTIKSGKTIRNLMVWTSSGNRIVEEKNLNTSSYNFRVTVNEKFFFIRVQLADGKTYSEKIGVQ